MMLGNLYTYLCQRKAIIKEIKHLTKRPTGISNSWAKRSLIHN